MGQHLSVYHIKSHVAKTCEDSFESILRNPSEVQSFDLTKEMPFEAQLFISKSEPEPPSWVAFLEQGFGTLSVPATQSINAVLFVRIPYGEAEEFFAFTFGHGRYLLKPKSYDEDYGLRVALNAIYERRKPGEEPDPNRLRSVAAKTVAANTIRTRRQADRQASFETFGVDIQRDILTAVTGTPVKSEFWSSRLSGSESLAATLAVAFQGLGDYCKSLVETYRENWYKRDFDWIDNRRAVTNPDMIEELKGTLIQTLKDTPEKITLTVPEIVDWNKVSHFYFLFNDEKNDEKEFLDPGDVDLMEALKAKNLLGKLDKEHLEDKWHLVVRYAQDDNEFKLSLLNCLSGEIEYNEQVYILSDGQFFEVRSDFLQKINAFIGHLPEKKDFLPPCSETTVEGEYNESTATGNSSLLLLDKMVVRLPGRTTPVEICDLLTDDGCFIHVKRKLNSSALSHLFAQGFVSADLLLRSQEYRVAALGVIRRSVASKAPTVVTGASSFTTRFSTFSPGGITPGEFEVLYAIIAKWNNKSFVDALPFFSKITLCKYVEDLRRMGYKVGVARIEVV